MFRNPEATQERQTVSVTIKRCELWGKKVKREPGGSTGPVGRGEQGWTLPALLMESPECVQKER